MSAREPLWYCHSCHAEMRPLMVPDPTCASCHGSFVEKMENPNDDPREFQRGAPGDFFPEEAGASPGMDFFLNSLQNVLGAGASGRSPRMAGTPTMNRGSGITVQIRNGSGQPRVISIGPRNPQTEDVPSMSEFNQSGPDGARTAITGPMMAQYLMAMLGGRSDPFADMLTQGRAGDYVFNQEALDEIMTQLMENSDSHRPVPATEEIIEKLPREVLEAGSSMLEKDCAVCKEQFTLETEEPDEQVVVTLPCKHPFHEGCILPWLKSSGTCPVCRYALIPQPEHHPPPQPGSPSSSSSPPRNTSPNSSDSGLFGSLFGHLTRNLGGSSSSTNTDHRNSSSSHNRRQSHDSRGSPTDPNNRNVPGGWDDLD